MVEKQVYKLYNDNKLQQNCGNKVFCYKFCLIVYFTFNADNLIMCRCKQV